MFKFGHIILVKFPFSNLQNFKERPALVLISGTNEDLVCAKITSNQNVNLSYSVNLISWKESNLLRPSIIRLDKIATFYKNQIIQEIGKLNLAELERIKNKFKEVYSEILN